MVFAIFSPDIRELHVLAVNTSCPWADCRQQHFCLRLVSMCQMDNDALSLRKPPFMQRESGAPVMARKLISQLTDDLDGTVLEDAGDVA